MAFIFARLFFIPALLIILAYLWRILKELIDLSDLMFQIFVKAIVLFTALPFHEFAHAWVANKLGDHTAAINGRLTLNPLAHLDPIGAICMLLTGFGWARAVPINPRNFKNPKKGMALSACAGPLANLLLALVCLILYKIAYYSPLSSSSIGAAFCGVLLLMVHLNIGLGIFNLLPIPPLDGSRLATLFLPSKWYFKIMQYEQVIFLAVFVLLFTGVLSTPLSFLSNLVLRGLDFSTGFLDILCRMIF